MDGKWICEFGAGMDAPPVEADAALLGAKGDSLVQMSGLGLPIPPGFIIAAGASLAYCDTGKHSPGLEEQVGKAWERLESNLRGLGRPSLVSVRCGSGDLIPGLMDSVLNL
ncbi:MAG: pyruvate, phosphate dikinase, partial [Hyphomicrobiales bacterium]|nr:pyruvate, phosphate dikinase [Hyphomicrobiales bacterium]